MTWIKTIHEDEADGDLKVVYDRVTEYAGKIPNFIRALSLYPEALVGGMALFEPLMFGDSTLTRAEREMIAIATSAANNCAYNVSHRAERLSHYQKDNDDLRDVISGRRFDGLPTRQARMLRYAVRLTNQPDKIKEKDIEELRGVGFSDREILEINLISAFFNMVDRVALGLGVTFQDEELSGYKR